MYKVTDVKDVSGSSASVGLTVFVSRSSLGTRNGESVSKTVEGDGLTICLLHPKPVDVEHKTSGKIHGTT